MNTIVNPNGKTVSHRFAKKDRKDNFVGREQPKRQPRKAQFMPDEGEMAELQATGAMKIRL